MDNWRTQIRKGYLELCILSLIEMGEKLYGFQLLDLLEESGIPVKEGTLYPLLNRMTNDGALTAKWQTRDKGHPRKFYYVTGSGRIQLAEMRNEFQRMNTVYGEIGEI